nr:TonB-dependent receptor [Sphingomonas flavalba]
MLTVACAALAAPALAQQPAPEPDSGADIIVTAQGRAQQLQDVPVAISAVSAETLQNSGANDIRQLNQVAPSLLVSSTGSEANGSARIRGIGTVGDNPGLESSVAVFIDGVYRSRSGIGLNELGEIERVEVLRGPQGTLGGRNASAGMLSIVSKKPSFSFGATAEATYGNYDYYRLGGSVTGPLGETIAARLDGVYVKRDGFYKDVVNDTRVNNRDRYFLRGQLLFEPSSDISFRLIGDYSKRDEACCAAAFVRSAEQPSVGGLLDPAQNNIIRVMHDLGQNMAAFTANPYDRNIYVSQGRSYAGKTQDWGVSGELNWDFGGARLVSITGYRNYASDQGSDTDYSQVDILYRDPGKDAYNREFKTFSQELRLQGSAFNDRLDWLVGGYYANETLDLTENMKFGRDYGRFATCRVVTGSPLAAFYDPTATGCISATGRGFLVSALPGALGPVAGPAVLAGFDRLDAVREVGGNNDLYRQKSNNFAIFTHNIIHLSDRIDLTLGARWTTEKKRFNATFNNNNTFCPAQQAAMGPFLANAALAPIAGALIALTCQGNSSSEINGVTVNDKRSEDQLTGTAILSWKVTDNALVYASYARGYKAGGFNLDRSAMKDPLLPFGGAAGAQALVGNLQFDAEKVNAYEIGGKFSFGRFTFNLAAFRQQFSNFQLNTFNGSVFIVQNVNGCGADLAGGDRDQNKFSNAPNYIAPTATDRSPANTTGACAAGDVGYGVVSQGVELEAVMSPSPYLQVAAGLTYADTHYRNNLVGNGSGAPLDQALRMLPGERLSNAPAVVATGSFTWTPPIGNSGLSGLVYFDTRMTSDYNTGSDLFPQKGQDGYALVNGRIGIRGPNEGWAIEVWGQNLFNKNYAQVAFNAPFQEGATGAPYTDPGYPGGRQIFSAFLAEPRTYGVTVRGKF